MTDSGGIRDYVTIRYTGLAIPPGPPEDFAVAPERLWSDPILCDRLGENGWRFARGGCTEERVAAHFRVLLADTDWPQRNHTAIRRWRLEQVDRPQMFGKQRIQSAANSLSAIVPEVVQHALIARGASSWTSMH